MTAAPPLDQTLESLRLATIRTPGDPRAWEKYGEIAAANQELPQAFEAFHRAHEIEPGNLVIALKSAVAASTLGRLRDARIVLERTAQLTPVNDAFFALYIDVLEGERDWAAISVVARTWSDRRPEMPRAWEARAKAAWESGRLHQAIDWYRKATAITGASADRLATIGRLCLNALEFDDAARALDAAEALDGRDPHTLSAKAGLLMYLGRFDEAEAYCRRCLAINADDITAYRILSQLKRGRLWANDIAALVRLSDDSLLRIEHRISAAFTLSDVRDTEGDTTAAFAALELAHRLAIERDRKEGLGYSAADRTRAIDAIIAHFATAATPVAHAGGPVPIFIIGMPRSGTTLIESVFGAHSRVLACGERLAMRQIMREYEASVVSSAAITPQLLSQLATSYLQDLPQLKGRDRITDKNPWNFDAVGLILKLFPEAHFVHVRRNPVETCWSIFRNEFPKFQTFTQRLEDIGHYYGEYARLMAHWERLAGARLTTIQYEDFVAGFDAAAPALLASCGLAWEENCRHFQSQPRAIATISTVQAREAVSDRSGRARRYDRHLAPLIDALTAAGVNLQTGELA